MVAIIVVDLLIGSFTPIIVFANCIGDSVIILPASLFSSKTASTNTNKMTDDEKERLCLAFTHSFGFCLEANKQGNTGIDRTAKRVQVERYEPGITESITFLVNACETCQAQ